MLTGFSMSKNGADGNCPPPANVTETGKTSSSISFDWDDVAGSTFLVYYTRDDYTSSVFTASVSNFTFSGLPAGTYDFYFQTDCGAEMSEIIGITDVIVG